MMKMVRIKQLEKLTVSRGGRGYCESVLAVGQAVLGAVLDNKWRMVDDKTEEMENLGTMKLLLHIT